MLWTDKQKQIAHLLTDGKSFSEIVAMGYLKSQVSDVKKALAAGDVPPELRKAAETPPATPPGSQPAGETTVPKTPPQQTPPPPKLKDTPADIIFWFGKSPIQLDPLDMTLSYVLYAEITERCGITDSFSKVLYDAMGTVWRLMVPTVPGGAAHNLPGQQVAEPPENHNGHDENTQQATELVAEGANNGPSQ